MEREATGDAAKAGVSDFAGKVFDGAMAIKGIDDDMNNGLSAGQAVVHIGGAIAVGEATMKIIKGLKFVAELDALPETIVVVGGGILISSLYNYAYDHNKSFHDFVNGIGNFLDKHVIEPQEHKYFKTPGHVVIKSEINPC